MAECRNETHCRNVCLDSARQTIDSSEIDQEVEKAWIEESERRISEYKKGIMKTVSAEDVFKRIKNEEL